MKNIGLILLIGILISSCNQNEKQTTNEIETAPITQNQVTSNFDWLLGNWKRVNEEDGKETFENWEKINETEYLGFGFTMQNSDTIQQETMQLAKVNGDWSLMVSIPEEEAVIFKMTEFTESEFICENHKNDFPNRIKYWKNGAKINASISNSEMEIPFEFETVSK